MHKGFWRSRFFSFSWKERDSSFCLNAPILPKGKIGKLAKEFFAGLFYKKAVRKPPVFGLLPKKGPFWLLGKIGFSQKGFWFSMDAILALCIMAILVLSFSQPKQNDWTALLVLQKQHDLVKVWQQTKTNSLAEMQKDVEFVFPNQSFELKAGNQTVQQQKQGYQPNASVIEATTRISAEETVSVFLKVNY